MKDYHKIPITKSSLVFVTISLLALMVFAAPVKADGFCDNVTQIPKSECEALITFYHNTDGPNWYGSIWAEEWLSTNTPCNWYGIECDQGHVVELAIWDDRLRGQLPPALKDLTKLERLGLSNNKLYGKIPPELGNLIHLHSLDLAENQLSGSIPSQLGNCINLESLSLAANQLSGNIPSQLGNLSNLESLHLNTNQLTGPIPPEIGNLVNLEFIGLYKNQLNGPIPPEIGNLINLNTLYLNHNQLDGDIPPEFGNLTSLTYLHLENNLLTGIPSELGNLSNLKDAFLRYNRLSGNIPSELGYLSNLEDLYLNNNQLNGNIPPELGNLSNIVMLYLNSNQLTGSIPPELSKPPYLWDLRLDHNQLTGSIPPEVGDTGGFLNILYLNDNLLNGPLPDNLTNLTYLRFLNFNNTALCEPENVSFQDWLNNIDYLERSNIICTPPQVITPTGGSLTSRDGQIMIQFPVDAVDDSTVITFTYYASQSTGNLVGMDRFFDLEASQNGLPIIQFNKPITIEVQYPNHHVLVEDTINLYWLNGTDWITDGINIISKTDISLTSLTDHLTLFAVLGETNSIYLPVLMKY